jgi:hypothetical protein
LVSTIDIRPHRVVISIYVDKGYKLITIKDDGRVYYQKGGKVELLSGEEIQDIVEDRLTDDFRLKIENKITDVERNCKIIKNLFYSMPILQKFENNSHVAGFEIKVITDDEIKIQDFEKIRKQSHNGYSLGNVFYMKEQHECRLPNAYLRYSLPTFLLRKLNWKNKEKETIFLVPGGGAFYSKKDYPVVNETIGPVLKIYNSKINAPYGMIFTLCFLKSSFLLWYCHRRFGNSNIHQPEAFNNLRMPIFHIEENHNKETITNIEKHFGEIMKLEKIFLASCSKTKKVDLETKTNEHNNLVCKLAYSIDQDIYKLLELNDAEIAIIENDLKLNNIYLPENIK